VQLANAGPVPFDLETSSNFTAYLFNRGGVQPVGRPEGGSVGTGLSAPLLPGQSTDIKILGGTASCDPSLGYVLPVGQYEARAFIDWSVPEGGLRFFWSEPAPIEVVAP
jgi:hypothetical protein